MKQRRLLEGIVIAVVAAIAAAVMMPVLSVVLAPAFILCLLIVVLSFGYLIYLLHRKPHKPGRVTVIGAWLIVSLLTWLFVHSLPGFAAIHLLMIWLVRALYFYNSVLSALADLSLTGLAFITALWAWTSTGSLFLAFWCLFLVQALFVLIPARIPSRSLRARNISADYLNDHLSNYLNDSPIESPELTRQEVFERARRSAQQALRKLAEGH
ncbi:MAG: hypothetical protein DRR06_12805 [Gammaproteobacteria bacterium]|nr:MAG: hypothetical protein DRR06_12805 [Gammaproteobacteria bacterium]